MVKHSLIVAVLLIPPGHNHAADHHQHQAHVHGRAELSLALEGNRLELHLESPAANILGFEHRASTPDQIRAVQNAKTVLESAEVFFSFVGTKCQLKQAVVDVSALLDDEAHHQEEHSEISAQYHFECVQGEELRSLSVSLMKPFSRIKKLNAQWITEARQGSVQLTQHSNTITLR